ncbi:MAG: amino acid transport protein [Pseudomonadaceae bacterium]|nr:amino acid transport protein [Pseudomonadaceae bacterium]
MDSTATLLSGLVFGSIGVGYLIYGKKQQRQAAFFSGIALIVYPYFISDPWLLWAIGLGLMAVPKFWKS